MAAKLRRLVSGTFASTTAAVIFTASTRTAVRAIDLFGDGSGNRAAFGVGAADAANVNAVGNFVYLDDSGNTSHWRGCVVLEPGETLVIDSTGVDPMAYMVNGAIDLALS